jgi:alpha-glucosidase
VLGNHDRPRIASRVGPDQARVAAMLLLTLRGTPTIYYGDEIGMQQVPIPPEQIRDPLEKNVPGQGLGRDGARTPLQWDSGKFAGFTTVTPWLPVAANYARQNIAEQSGDPGSIYRLYRRLLALRREQPALWQGSYRPISASGDLLLYMREFEGDRIFVVLNFGSEPTAVALPTGSPSGKLLVSTFGDRDRELVREIIDIRGNEGLVVELSKQAVDALPD